jgi:hypothetical protein
MIAIEKAPLYQLNHRISIELCAGKLIELAPFILTADALAQCAPQADDTQRCTRHRSGLIVVNTVKLQ